MERSRVLQSYQHSYRKNLGTCDALLDIVSAGQMELDRGGELALVQIDFCAAFDRVNYGGLVIKLQDSVCSSSVDVVFGVPQGSFLGSLLFLLYIADFPELLKNVLVGNADNSTLFC